MKCMVSYDTLATRKKKERAASLRSEIFSAKGFVDCGTLNFVDPSKGEVSFEGEEKTQSWIGPAKFNATTTAHHHTHHTQFYHHEISL